MKRARVLVTALVATVALVAGCGGDDDDGAPPTADGVDLRTEVLAVEDLPSGWAPDEDEDDDEAAFSCLRDVQDLDEVATAAYDVSFARGVGNFLFEGIAYFDDRAEGERTYDELTETFGNCGEIDEDGFTGSIDETDFEQYGDQSKAFTVALEKEDIGFEFVFLFIQQGSRFVLLGMGDLGELDRDELEQAAETAMDKLAA